MEAEGDIRDVGGRPALLEPDERTIKQVRSLSGMQCTQQEAAAALGVSTRAFKYFLGRHEEARRAWDEGTHFGKASIKRAQFEVGVKDKNVQMLIWLGKQHLDQVDKQETTHKQAEISPEERLKRIQELQAKALELPAPKGEANDES